MLSCLLTALHTCQQDEGMHKRASAEDRVTTHVAKGGSRTPYIITQRMQLRHSQPVRTNIATSPGQLSYNTSFNISPDQRKKTLWSPVEYHHGLVIMQYP